MASHAGSRRRRSRVRKHFNYTVYEAADELGVCRNTIRRWIAGGLKVVDGQRPFLIIGSDLNAFLERQRRSAKQPCGPGRMFCLRCGEPRAPVPGLIDFVWNGQSAGNLKALCETCGTVMNRRCAFGQIAAVLPNLAVNLRRT